MINLFDLERSYLQEKEPSEINTMYNEALADASEAEQFDIWKQVCGFANAEMVEKLIAKGWAAARVEDPYGNTLLHLMAQAPNARNYVVPEQRVYETTRLLLAAKVSPLRKNNDGDTALMLGAKAGYFEMFQAYQEIGAKTDFTDRNGNTLLHLVAQYASQDRLSQFITFALLAIEFGADPYQKNNMGETAIDVAVRYKSKAIGAILKGADLSDEKTAPLYFQAGGMDVFQACISGDTEALQALIQLGENLNETYDKEGDNYQGMTALSIAMVKHDFDCTNVLLKNGADPMLLDSKSWHPFRYLYTPSSNVNTGFADFEHKTFQRILKSYIEAGFEINSLLDDEENTLLLLSAKYADRLTLYNSQTVATVLINEAVYADADVNRTNREGISALMYLGLGDASRAEKNFLLLLEQGASTELRDKNGKTALIYAVNNSDQSVAKTYCELLAEFGNLLLDAKDNTEKSALDYAVAQNNEPLVAWILNK
jgi:ankyrin repeat protein